MRRVRAVVSLLVFTGLALVILYVYGLSEIHVWRYANTTANRNTPPSDDSPRSQLAVKLTPSETSDRQSNSTGKENISQKEYQKWAKDIGIHAWNSADTTANRNTPPSDDSPRSQLAVKLTPSETSDRQSNSTGKENISQKEYQKWAKDIGQSMCSDAHQASSGFPRLQLRDNTNLTVVTAFFSIGSFQKGGNPKYVFSVETYMQWAQTFLYLQNPLIVFTDYERFADLFRHNFTGKNLKIVFVSNRTSLLAFQKLPRITQVLSAPGYPKHHPNTVIPEYSCAQHAKADVVEQAMAWDAFHTTYFAWIDVGYFRNLLSRKKKFWIAVPPELDEQKIAVCEITKPSFSLSAEAIFKRNIFWVGGGMYLGTRPTYSKFVADYRRAMDHFLSAGLANSDQQVLHSMFKPDMKKALNVTTELQLFSWRGCWFYLGYHCYREQ